MNINFKRNTERTEQKLREDRIRHEKRRSLKKIYQSENY